MSLWLAGSALTDTVIAVSMTYLLLRSRRRYYAETNNILVRIVRLTVTTNSATAVVAIVQLIFLPHNRRIAIAPTYALGKLYSNTVLAIFNSRVYSRGMVSRNGETTSTRLAGFHDLDQSTTESTKSNSKRGRSRSEPPHAVLRFKESQSQVKLPLQTPASRKQEYIEVY
ncbi:hypothetical protein H0H93_006210 [Arthromyces matolae]|nr:hypothetical protein H0H93_006210 [Arthromyces matolae]